MVDTIFNYEADFGDAITALDRSGFFVFRNYVSKKAVNELITLSHHLYHNDYPFVRNTRPSNSAGSYRLNLVPARLKKSNNLGTTVVETLGKIVDHKQTRKLACKALRSKAGVSNMIFDYSLASSERERTGVDLFPLHYDWRDYSNCLKFYIYLSDVDVEQGAIRYVPGSHLVVKKMWETHTAELTALMKVNESWNSLLSMSSLLTELDSNYDRKVVDILRKIVDKPKKSLDFSVTAESGDVLVFDENGIHGGGPLQTGSRMIFRIHYVDREYVNKNLSDQQSILRRIKGRFIGTR